MEKPKETSKPEASRSRSEKSVQKMPAQKKTQKSQKLDDTPEIVINCSFCGKSSSKAKMIIAGPTPANSNICDECLEVCLKLLIEELPTYWYHRLLLLFMQIKINKKQSLNLEQKQLKTKKGRKA